MDDNYAENAEQIERRDYITRKEESERQSVIQNILARLDILEGKSGTRWIPVTERLPEDRCICLVAWDGWPMDVNIAGYDNKTDKFYSIGDSYIGDIAYWMPLPKSPDW